MAIAVGALARMGGDLGRAALEGALADPSGIAGEHAWSSLELAPSANEAPPVVVPAPR